MAKMPVNVKKMAGTQKKQLAPTKVPAPPPGVKVGSIKNTKVKPALKSPSPVGGVAPIGTAKKK